MLRRDIVDGHAGNEFFPVITVQSAVGVIYVKQLERFQIKNADCIYLVVKNDAVFFLAFSQLHGQSIRQLPRPEPCVQKGEDQPEQQQADDRPGEKECRRRGREPSRPSVWVNRRYQWWPLKDDRRLQVKRGCICRFPFPFG